MARTLQAFALLFALALSPIALADILAQDFGYTGGTIKGIKVKTGVSPVFTHGNPTPAAPGPFEQLASSELTVHVNAGDSDLFVYEIDAACNVHGGVEDRIDLQARVNGLVRGVIGGPAFLQPQGVPASLGFCPGPLSIPNVVAMSWVTRLGGGNAGFDYTFTIWWRAVDRIPLETATGVDAVMNNRIVKLTRYEGHEGTKGTKACFQLSACHLFRLAALGELRSAPPRAMLVTSFTRFARCTDFEGVSRAQRV